jgi:putative ATP-dependent endonuclease of OLD family
MRIERVIIKNYRTLENVDVRLNPEMNIIVGNNESGKSTFLEAIHLALTGQLYGRNAANEFHPFLFNLRIVAEYLAKLGARKPTEPPSILIELYLEDDPKLAAWRGENNSTRRDCPGVALSVRLHEDYRDLYYEYVRRVCAKPRGNPRASRGVFPN